SWTKNAIHTIWVLYQVTKIPSLDPKLQSNLQFSYMEALYARGFTTAERIVILSQTQFQQALAGTVAYPATVANAIHDLAIPIATPTPNPGPEPASGFSPVNPGDLVNCIPPPNLSPLGPVEYLHELLQFSIVTVSGTKTGTTTLADILAIRRGPVG